MFIDEFNIGLQLRVCTNKSPIGSAKVLENLDTSKICLVPLKKETEAYDDLLPIISFHRYNGEWITTDERSWFTELNGKVYWTDSTGLNTIGIAGDVVNMNPDTPTGTMVITQPNISTVDDHIDTKRLDEIYANRDTIVMNFHYVDYVLDISGNPLTNMYRWYNEINTQQEYIENTGDSTNHGYAQYIGDIIGTNLWIPRNRIRYQDMGPPDGWYFVKIPKLIPGFTNQVTTGGGVVHIEDMTPAHISEVTSAPDRNSIRYEWKFTWPLAYKAWQMNTDISYMYTIYDSVTGVESQPSPIKEMNGVLPLNTEYVDVGLAHILVIDDLALVTANSDLELHLYRVGGDLGEWTLVKKYAQGDYVSATNTLVDDTADVDVEGTISNQFDTTNAPLGMVNLTTGNGYLVGSKDNKIYFSKAGQPGQWDIQTLEVNDTITGMVQVSFGLIVMTETRTYLVRGYDFLSFDIQIISGSQGCISHESIDSIGGSAIWVSNEGICMSSGGQVDVISRPYLGTLRLSPVDSTVFDDQYFLLLEDNKILKVDFRWGNIIMSNITLDNPSATSINRFDNKIYYSSTNRIYSMFSDIEDKTIRFWSNILVDNLISIQKEYRKINITYTGELNIKISLDNILAIEVDLSSTKIVTERINFPEIFTKGYYVNIDIEGKGIVFEINSPVVPS